MTHIAPIPSRIPRPLRRGLLIFACVIGGLIAAVAQVRATTVNTFTAYTSEETFIAATNQAGYVRGTISFAGIEYPTFPAASSAQPATFTEGGNSITAQTDGGLMAIIPIGLMSASNGTSSLVGFSGYPMNLSDFNFPDLQPVLAVGGRFSLTDIDYQPIGGQLRLRLYQNDDRIAESTFLIDHTIAGYGTVTPGVFLGIVSTLTFDSFSVESRSGSDVWVGVASVVLAGPTTAPAPSSPVASSAGASSVPDGGASLVMLGSALFALAGAASRWRRRK